MRPAPGASSPIRALTLLLLFPVLAEAGHRGREPLGTTAFDARCGTALERTIDVSPAELARLEHTLAAEWEFLDIPTILRERRWPKAPAFDAMDASNLRTLYGLFGKDENGRWVEGLLPAHVADSAPVRALRNERPDLFRRTEGQWFLNGPKLSRSDRFPTYFALLEARGKGGYGLALRKRPEAFASGTSPLDALLPDVLAEEWRAGKLVNLEFPLNGKVRTPEEVRAFRDHLMARLGWFDLRRNGRQVAREDVRFETLGHVHSVIDPRRAQRRTRLALYQRQVAEWSDLNDAAEVRWLAPATHHMAGGVFGNEHLLADYLNRVETRLVGFMPIGDAHVTGPFGLLTRELYQHVSVADDGVRIEGQRAGARDFPEQYKNLRVGLRAFYLGPITEDTPVPVLGLELRELESGMRMDDALRAVKTPAELLSGDYDPRPRGFVSDSQALKKLAERHGIDPRIVDQVDKHLQHFLNSPRKKLAAGSYRGLLFLPLNDLLRHPVAQRAAQNMRAEKRTELTDAYGPAMERYISRLNELSQRMATAKSSWLEYRLARFEAKAHFTEVTDKRFRQTLLAYLGIFLAESHLGELFAP